MGQNIFVARLVLAPPVETLAGLSVATSLLYSNSDTGNVGSTPFQDFCFTGSLQ